MQFFALCALLTITKRGLQKAPAVYGRRTGQDELLLPAAHVGVLDGHGCVVGVGRMAARMVIPILGRGGRGAGGSWVSGRRFGGQTTGGARGGLAGGGQRGRGRSWGRDGGWRCH